MNLPRFLLTAGAVGLLALTACNADARRGDDDGSDHRSSHHDSSHHGAPHDEDHLWDDHSPRREAFCKDNPVTCERLKVERDARQKWCESSKAQCDKLKAERDARREKMRQWCVDHPDRCEDRRERRGRGRD